MSDTIWVVRDPRGKMRVVDCYGPLEALFAWENHYQTNAAEDAALNSFNEQVLADPIRELYNHNGYTLRRITLPTDAERHLVEAGLRYVSAKRAYHNLANGASDEPQFGTLGDADDAISEAADAVRAERAATTRVSVASSASVQSGGKWVPIPDMGPTRNNATWQATAENDGTERAATSPGDAPRATGA